MPTSRRGTIALRFLSNENVKRIVEALTPRFLGRDQDHLIALADETAGVALDITEGLTDPLYDFKADIEGPGGAELVGILDLGGYFTGTNVEDALQELATMPAIVADGDKGEITVTGGIWTLDPDAVALVNASIADRARANHTGTQSLDTTTDSATRLALTPAERTKLNNTSGTNTGDQTLAGLGGQPLDATLTALAGNNWASSTVPIGIGADTMTQLTVGANQFVARNSSGGLNAHTVTDFALALLDDANAAAARTTMEVISGTYTPTFVGVSNVTGTPTTADVWMYTRIGDTVQVTGNVIVTTTAASTLTQFRISLPISSNLQSASNDDCVGTGTAGSGVTQPAVFVRSDTVNDNAFAQFGSVGAGSTPVRVKFTYRIRA